MEENRIEFEENAWVRWGAVSGRHDFVSPFPNLCSKDGERYLLFILVLLLRNVHLPSIPDPPQGAGGVTHSAGLLPRGHLLVPDWDGRRHRRPLGRGVDVWKGCARTESPFWPSSQCSDHLVGFAPWGQPSDAGALLEQNCWGKEGEQRRRVFKLPPLASVPVVRRSRQSEL